MLLAAVLALGVPVPEADLAARAARLHREAIVIDTHLDVPYALGDAWPDLATEGSTPHVDIPRLRRGGLRAGFFAVYVPARYAKGGAARFALERSDVIDRLVAAHPETFVAASDVAGIRGAHRAGRIAVLKGIEGGHALEDSLGALRSFHALGVRYLTLTHTNTNRWADSAGSFADPDFDPRTLRVHRGLTGFGRRVIREMNRLGMAVDVSHASDEVVEQALSVSRAPIFASHSSCRALTDNPRNLTDDQIRRIGAAGGVVMINFGSRFVSQGVMDALRAFQARVRPRYVEAKAKWASDPVRQEAELKAIREENREPRATLAQVVDHVEHALRLAPGGVGLGSDFDGVTNTPRGLDDVSFLPALTAELLRRGHSEEEIRGVLGENLLRFLDRVERTASALRDEPPDRTPFTP